MIEWLERKSYTAAGPLSLSPDDIERIIECVGFPVEQAKRVILQRWLNWSVSNYRSDRADPTPANMRDRLAAIAKRAQSLLCLFASHQSKGDVLGQEWPLHFGHLRVSGLSARLRKRRGGKPERNNGCGQNRK